MRAENVLDSTLEEQRTLNHLFTIDPTDHRVLCDPNLAHICYYKKRQNYST